MTDRNLYQRLRDISGDVQPVPATGKTAQGQRTISIVDVENSLRFLFVRHSVVAGFRWNEPPKVVEVYVTKEGKERPQLWQGDVTVFLLNPDAPTEILEMRVIEHGSSPSAIVSFALKRVYRSLFHLADETDEGHPVSRSVARTSQARDKTPQEASEMSRPIQEPVRIPGPPGLPDPRLLTLVDQADKILNPPMSTEEFEISLKRLKIPQGRATFTAARLFQKPINLEDLSGEQRAQLVAELEGIVMSKAVGTKA